MTTKYHMTRIVVNTFLIFFKFHGKNREKSVSEMFLDIKKSPKRGNPNAEGIGVRIMRGFQGQAPETVNSIPYLFKNV